MKRGARLKNHNYQSDESGLGMFSFFLLMLLVFATAMGGAYFATKTIFEPISPQKSQIEPVVSNQTTSYSDLPEVEDDYDYDVDVMHLKDRMTVLILGVDERKDDVGRSDTMMVAMIDPESNRVSLISIPRDTRVRIRNRGYDKINAAYAYGGIYLALNTVENLIGVNIDHYMIVNTKNFVKIIDAIGGVDINVKQRMYYEDPWDDDGGLMINFYPGRQHMNGKTAVTYVRYRDEEGDIGRVERQQDFMRACMDKVMSPMIIPKLPRIVNEITNSVKTDLSISDLLAIAGTVHSAHGLETAMAPGSPTYINEISYWIPDVEYLRDLVYEAAGLTADPYMRAQFARSAERYNADLPSEIKVETQSGNRPLVSSVAEAEERSDRYARESSNNRRNQRSETRSEERSNQRSNQRAERRSEPRVEQRAESDYESYTEPSRDSREYSSSIEEYAESRYSPEEYEDVPNNNQYEMRYEESETRYEDQFEDQNSSRYEEDESSREYVEIFPSAEELEEESSPRLNFPSRNGGMKTR